MCFIYMCVSIPDTHVRRHTIHPTHIYTYILQYVVRSLTHSFIRNFRPAWKDLRHRCSSSVFVFVGGPGTQCLCLGEGGFVCKSPVGQSE